MSYKRAFTLIELLVIIAIIGILSGIIFIYMNKAVDSAKDVEKISNIDVLRRSLLAYSVEHGEVYPVETVQCTIGSCGTLDSKIVPQYLSTIPDDAEYKYISADGKDFTISAEVSDTKRYQYSSSDNTLSAIFLPPCYFWEKGIKYGYGDVNNDGQISLVDAQKTTAAIYVNTDPAPKVMDVNGVNSYVDFNDAGLILRFSQGEISTFPICSMID